MKTIPITDAVALIPDGATLMIGGFMGVGTPERIVDELVRQGKQKLTVIANDTAVPGRGVGKLVDADLIARTVASHCLRCLMNSADARIDGREAF
jgi:acetate CoA/acetoacetate CoA-transferase alpha subunit